MGPGIDPTDDESRDRPVARAQREWLGYRDAQVAAIRAMYTEGSISEINRASATVTLTKEQVQKLEQFVGELPGR